jgi:heptosyltransferase-1
MHVLIIRLSAIGDVVQGIPCLVALKESSPSWKFSWLVEEKSAPLLRGHPCLDHLFVLSKSGFASYFREHQEIIEGNFWNILSALRRAKVDISIDLQGLMKSAVWGLLSGSSRRVGHKRSRESTWLFINERVGLHDVFDPDFPLHQRYLEPAAHLGADLSKARYALPKASAEEQASVQALLSPFSKDQPILAICPWSAWHSKNWPTQKWLRLIHEFSADYQMILLGDASQAAQAQDICLSAPKLLNLVGKTSLTTLPELFRHISVVLGPDSGPLHIANATSIPHIIMLFGSTSWKRSGPVGKGHLTLSTELPCQPCFKRTCPLQHLNCQNDLSVDRVILALRQVLHERESVPPGNL